MIATTIAAHAASAQVRPHRALGFGFQSESGWDNNVRFDSTRVGDRLTRAGGSLALASHTERTGLAATASAYAILFDKLKDLNSVSYDGRLDATRRMTARATGSASLGLDRRYSSEMRGPEQDAVLLPGNGETGLLPRVGVSEMRGRAGGVYRLSPTLSGATEAEYSRVRFDAPYLPGGSTVDVTGRVTRHVNPHMNVGFDAQAERFVIAGRTFDAQKTAVAWSVDRPSLALRADAGVTRVGSSSDSIAASFSPYVLAELSRITPSTTLMAAYTHRVSPAFGVGRLLVVDQIMIALTARLPGDTHFRAIASQARSSDVDRSSDRLVSSNATAELDRQLVAGVNVGSRVTWRHRAQIDIASAAEALLILGYRRAAF